MLSSLDLVKSIQDGGTKDHSIVMGFFLGTFGQWGENALAEGLDGHFALAGRALRPRSLLLLLVSADGVAHQRVNVHVCFAIILADIKFILYVHSRSRSTKICCRLASQRRL